MTEITVLIVEDDDMLREALSDTLQLAGYRPVVAENGEKALQTLGAEHVDLVVTDVQMAAMDGHALLRAVKCRWPQMPVALMTAYGTIEKAVSAMRDGAEDYLVKPFEAEVLIEMVTRLAGCQAPGDETAVMVDERSQKLMALALRVADSEATVMISGESGVGKEVVARAIHQGSPRRDQPFVAINCAALPETMLESLLFGYEKGAFTGAYQARAGKFEQAQGGTLLLDEISEMDIGLQAKLLRVLQEKEVERLGGKSAVALDVRVLATTNRDLLQEVQAGRFREDLYYRLNVFPLTVPPLRDRPGDVVPLAEYFLSRFSKGGARVLAPGARQRLLGHRWPGNVRELHNVMQRAEILSRGNVIETEDIHLEIDTSVDVPLVEAATGECADVSAWESGLRDRECEMIVEALRAANGRRKETAERLGISPRTLRYKLAKLREAGVALPGIAGT